MKDLEPFLYLPFKKQKYLISEGWYYSAKEQSVHGHKGHGAIDFDLPRGAEVLAAADGWAIASYAWALQKAENGQPRLYQNKAVGYGFGYFVQIYHPENNLFTAYGHLEQFAPSIKFHRPIKRGDKYTSVGHKVKPGNLPNYSLAVKVEAGDVIGYVGDSGLTWDYEDYPIRPDPEKFPSWDTTHIHFEVFERVGSKGKKRHFEPYGIKGATGDDYPDSLKLGRPLGEKSPILWLLNSNSKPSFIP